MTQILFFFFQRKAIGVGEYVHGLLCCAPWHHGIIWIIHYGDSDNQVWNWKLQKYDECLQLQN